MGLYDPPDGEGIDLGGFIEEMMRRQRGAQLDNRFYALTMGTYEELMAIEPEKRTAQQEAIAHFLETLNHNAVASLGWCGNDEPGHAEEHITSMRAVAIQMKQEWDAAALEDPESYNEVQGWINRTVEGIDK